MTTHDVSTLNKYKALLEIAQHSGVISKIETKYHVSLALKNLIDCGTHACAWVYNDSVFKLTRSAEDASATIELLRMRRAGLPKEIADHIAKVFEVCVPDTESRERIWIIVVERLDPLAPGEVEAIRAFHKERKSLLSPQGHEFFFESALKVFSGDLARKASAGEVERAWEAWRALVLLERDYHVSLWADAHAGNFGKDARGNLKLFDFGWSHFPYQVAVPVGCEWQCPIVAPNPSRMSTKANPWAVPPSTPGAGVRLKVQGYASPRVCEVRADAFMFPPPPPQSGQVVREITEEERKRRRYYVDVRAIVHVPDELFLEEQFFFTKAVRVLFEIISGALTRPRLKNWDENRCGVFTTDYASFFEYRAATKREVIEFTDVASRCWPRGLPIGAFTNDGKPV